MALALVDIKVAGHWKSVDQVSIKVVGPELVIQQPTAALYKTHNPPGAIAVDDDGGIKVSDAASDWSYVNLGDPIQYVMAAPVKANTVYEIKLWARKSPAGATARIDINFDGPLEKELTDQWAEYSRIANSGATPASTSDIYINNIQDGESVWIKDISVKEAAWKPVDQIMEKVAGHWKHIGTTAHPPLFTGAIGDLQAVVGEAFTKDVSHLFSTGPVPASYSLNNPPAGMVISNAGVISWPSPTKVSVSGVSVTATNAGGFAVSDAFGVSAIALGPELIVNGDFASDDLSSWPNHVNGAVVNGELVVTVSAKTSPGSSVVGRINNVTIGSKYLVRGNMRSDAANSIPMACGVMFMTPTTKVGVLINGVDTKINFQYKPLHTYASFYLYARHGNVIGDVGDKAYFDNISVREILP